MGNWLTFELGGESYGCRLNTIKEVVNFQTPVPVPGASHLVEGVLNLRGEIVPVVSATRLLDLVDEPAKFILVRESKSGLMGIPVQKLGEIVNIDEHQIDPSNHSDSAVIGTAPGEHGLIILINFKVDFFTH